MLEKNEEDGTLTEEAEQLPIIPEEEKAIVPIEPSEDANPAVAWMQIFYIVLITVLFACITIAVCNEKPPKKEIPKKRGGKCNRRK